MDRRASLILAIVAVVAATPRGVRAADAAAPDTGAALLASAGDFTIHRVPNPRYRARSLTAAIPIAERMRSLRALDYYRAGLVSRGWSGAKSTDWSFTAGEESRRGGSIEIAANGVSRAGEPGLVAAGITGTRDHWTGTIGDCPPATLEGVATLHRLRGAAIRVAPERGPLWLAAAGASAPVQGAARPRWLLAGASVTGVAYDEARLSFAVAGFAQPHRSTTAPPGSTDTLASRGVSASTGLRAPLFGGALRQSMSAQAYGAPGGHRAAASHVLEWALVTPQTVVLLHDEHSSRAGLVVGTERATRLPLRSSRGNVQRRFFAGRAELHGTGLLQAGGEPELEARSLQLGASGDLGGAWYSGADATWSRRGRESADERRLAIQAGTAGGRIATLVRLEHVRAGERRVLALEDESSVALAGGRRLALAPSLAWDAARLDRAALRLELGAPLADGSTRLTTSLVVESARERGFRGTLREATLALAWAPRARDRARLEVRRQDEAVLPAMEVALDYEGQAERVGWLGAGGARRDSLRLLVHVARAGNGSGASDVLVSLDGRELRFTDADGIARFDRVGPGVHVVVIEERSLPDGHQVIGTSRSFVTIERGVAPETVTFTIARPERRVRF